MRERLNKKPDNPFVYAVLMKKSRKLMTVWRARDTAKKYIKKFKLGNKAEVRKIHLYDVIDLRNMRDGRSLYKTRERLKEK